MKNRVINTIVKHKLIEEGDHVVVGVSGGPDSMALLYILNDLRKSLSFNLHVAHINHQIRGKEADEDEEHVKQVCLNLGLPFYIKRKNAIQYAQENRISEEEAGRIIRYNFFREILAKMGKGKIAVAHNKNDQAETVLMRIIRGTGIDGLKGMGYRNDNIIRPLLDIKRNEIESFCIENNIPFRIDKTNLQPIYGRNKIRLELIPYIEKNFNSAIIDTLFRISKIVENDSDFLNKYSKEKYKEIIIEESEKKVILSKLKFLELDYAIQSRILRLTIEKINKELKGIEEKHITEMIQLINKDATGKMINLPNGMVLKLSYDNFDIEMRNEKITKHYKYKINIGNPTYIEELNSYINAKVVDINEININFKSDFVKYFDYDTIKGELYIRNRRKGDRFVPSGMKGSKKLKDFFIDNKIPRENRDIIPLITDEDNIIWVIGYRTSELYKITKKTKKVLILEYNVTKEE